MNLKELAKRDAALTIEGMQAGNTECILSDGSGNSWKVKMLLGDVGFTVDSDGNKIAGRTCWATYLAERVQNSEGVELTPKEYDLLFYLVRNKNIALTRDKLLEEVWGYDFFGDDRTIDTHVKNLRNCLGPYRKFIVTLRGVGYKFEYED